MATVARGRAWKELLRTTWVLSLSLGVMAMLRGAGIWYADRLERRSLVLCDGVSFEQCEAALRADVTARVTQWMSLGLALCLLGFLAFMAERRRSRVPTAANAVPTTLT